MKRCLILLTTGYPFTSAEPYLEAELPIAAARFSHVFLFAVGLRPGLSPIAATPENVVVCNCASLSGKAGRATDLLHGLPTAATLDGVAQTDRTAVGASVAKRAFLGYYLARVQRHASEIEACLADVDFSLYDEVCLYSYWFFVTAGVAVKLREYLRSRGVENNRLISRAHSYDLYAYANRLSYLPCRTALLDALDGVYVCSHDGENYLKERHPEFRDKIHTAYLGSSGGERTDGSTYVGFRILTCCRTIPLKRLDRLADALKMLPADSRIEWTHIGDGSALPALRRQCGDGFAGARVRFVGALPHEEVLEYYRSHPVDLFVNLSSREGLPVAVMEALSFGVPALVTDVGGCGEMIRNGKNGFLLPRDFTSPALCDLLRLAMRRASQMRDDAFATWQERFCAQTNYTDFCRVLCGDLQ